MRSLLVTGGTGSFGKSFISEILKEGDSYERIIVFSRDELKQWEMGQEAVFQDKRVRFFLGDIRDRDRLRTAMRGVDHVVHAAALKQVPAAEYNPFEFIRTNVLGTENVMQAAIESKVSRVVALSTDKAAAPVNLYGATKLCADKLVIAANNMVGGEDKRFSVVRYGNVNGSRGSVMPLFKKQAKEGYLNITDPEMTRFSISLREAVAMVKDVIARCVGGEIYIPIIPSYKLSTLAEAVAPHIVPRIVGVRSGEKIHEEMITTADSFNTYTVGKYHAIIDSKDTLEKLMASGKVVRYPEGISYNSRDNSDFLSIEALSAIIRGL